MIDVEIDTLDSILLDIERENDLLEINEIEKELNVFIKPIEQD